ncbi:PREDICTED: aldose 1-epimerase-like [Ceratosolen solmsi marchali]|uniref:Galactose mutarotase n=1 Tax=Ceratosolen solmsi marchali TaxID=326594 RepID=A0AAJ6YFR3_9HYME|nr:PREDICTED: aldose 1-epimerase-like [Ceratosolen solmsi marchali]
MSMKKFSRIEVNNFGTLPDKPHEIIRRYTIKNKNNACVQLITLGAGIQSITLPNKNGDIADVVLGFDNVTGYLKNRYIGRIVGKVLNPLTKFSYGPNKNADHYCLFDIVNWDSYILGEQVVIYCTYFYDRVMTHVNCESNKKYIGDLLIQVKYTWTDDNQLHVDINAMSTKPMHINVESHCLFNLAGHDMGMKELKCHVVTINTNNLLQLNTVKDISINFINKIYKKYNLHYPSTLSKKRLHKVAGGGYSHNICIASSSNTWYYQFHARMLHPVTGRFLEVYSNHPSLYLYTGNDLPNSKKINPPDINKYDKNQNKVDKLQKKIIGKNGIPYKRHGCFAFIAQEYQKPLNYKNYPSNNLYPGKIYSHNITYKFGIVV